MNSFGENAGCDVSLDHARSDALRTTDSSDRTVGAPRRANSFNFYKQIVGADPAPVKVANTPGTMETIASLPIGATVQVTVTGVNDAGEGPASAPVSVVVT